MSGNKTFKVELLFGNGFSGFLFLLVVMIVFFCLSILHAEQMDNYKEVNRSVVLDEDGILRWQDSGEEVAFFGVNYCLPSGSGYRMVKKVGASLEKTIDNDIYHLTRMGINGLRLSFWGDWENSDVEGNLIDNEHLKMLDYLIYKARQSGLYMLLSPIVGYNSNWPDLINNPDETARGFSSKYPKRSLGIDPNAIKSQINYIDQIVNHVNKFTGVAYKDDSSIFALELVNEPEYPSVKDYSPLIYVNKLVEAARKAGWHKPVIFNVSQNIGTKVFVADSNVDGVSFGWYPNDLLTERSLKGNYLINVEDYSLMRDPLFKRKAKLVYEFDAADIPGSYMYPAMARTFRAGGCQFAAMFTYDPLPIASTNIDFQTHYLNFIYTPNRVISLMIASEAFRRLPRLKSYGNYPESNKFDAFYVSYEKDLSEMADDKNFMYSNNTQTKPANLDKLGKIVGCGSSIVVRYDGTGCYFLEKVKKGIWRLELYPDVAYINDFFETPRLDREVSRVIWRKRNMEINLPDLGKEFTVKPVNSGNCFTPEVNDGKFEIKPGIYVLGQNYGSEFTPDSSGAFGRISFNKFVVPEIESKPTIIQHTNPEEITAGKSWQLDIEVISEKDPEGVIVYVRRAYIVNATSKDFYTYPMQMKSGFLYSVEIPAEMMKPGLLEYCISVTENGNTKIFPSGFNSKPTDWNFPQNGIWQTSVVPENSPVVLFDALKDRNDIMFSHSWGGIPRNVDFVTGSEPSKLALRIEVDGFKWEPFDVSCKYELDKEVKARLDDLRDSNTLSIRARSDEDDVLGIALIETDGTAWGTEISITSKWQEIQVELDKLTVVKAAMLPRGWPEVNPYWMRTSEDNKVNKATLEIQNVNAVQFSLGARFYPKTTDGKHTVEIESIKLEGKKL
jgi:hypothetical protein